jgi:CHAT domain-containing protein/lipopolysaccharide biosynthesis regulator YciM
MFMKRLNVTRRVLGALYLGALIVLMYSTAAAAATCDALMTGHPAAYETTIALQGREQAERTVHLPAQTNVLVFAREAGLDVTLEVTGATKALMRADSPIQRSGIQRVAFTTGEETDYSLRVTGKEHTGAKGRVTLLVVTMPRSESNDPCLVTQQKMAAGDAAYAAAQASTRQASRPPMLEAPALYKAAATAYAVAAARLKSAGSSPLLAQAQHAEAAVFVHDILDWERASTVAQEAARAYAAVDDAYGKARAQAIEAEAGIEIASAPRAPASAAAGGTSDAFARVRELLTAIATFHAARGELYDEALARNNIGVSHHLEGSYEAAIRTYRRALQLFEQLGEQSWQAGVLQNIALVEYELGRLSDAIPHYAQVLELLQQDDDPMLFASILSNSALSNWASGNVDAALRQFNEALTILRSVKDPYLLAVALHNIGCVYDTLGDQERALEFYKQALALRTRQLDARGRTASLRTIGNILRERGDASGALKMHEEALSLASGPSAKARILVQVAKDLGASGRRDEALKQLEVVLQRSAPGDEVVRARALAERSELFAARGEGARAAADLRAALATFHKYESPEDEFEAWVALARIERAGGASGKAFEALDRALALAEELRVQSANPELRATRLQPLRSAFDLKIAMLADRYSANGADVPQRERVALLALSTAEQARARALVDFQNLDVSAPGVPAELVTQRRSIYRELAARRFRLAVSLDRGGAGDARVGIIRADIAALRQQLDEIDARIGAASDSAAARRAKSNDRVALDFRALPKDTAIIEYWLGGDSAYAWQATSAGVVMVRLGPSSRVTEMALAYHKALRSFGSVPVAQRLKLGAELYALVLKPLDVGASSPRKLVFALDGALHYIPFATLRVPEQGATQFLVESHDISITPSIGMLLGGGESRRAQAPTKEMLLVADPVYELSDSRLATIARQTVSKPKASAWSLALLRGVEDGDPLPRLPGTAQEAAAIAALLPKESVDRLEGFTATRDRFLSAGLERYRFIHIASHALNDAEIPQASALILSTLDRGSREIDGRVLAADFVNLKLNAETVVLSACDTAVGKSVAGEGLIGLQYVVLARGAGSVLSSLWPVSDQVTAQLMGRFYTSRLRGSASVSAALSEAMRTMITGSFKDPGLWGAFTLTVGRTTGAPGT